MLRTPADRWHEVDALLRAALEHPASERAAYLQRECPNRPDLRREVELLLEAAAMADEWADSMAAVVAEAAQGALPGEELGEDAEPPSHRIGRYRIVQRIARGGMGTVYLARRADGVFERHVALKLLRRGLDSEDILERFRRERQILAGLEHPNIARLIDGGATGDGRPYLVMEFVRGVPITTHCDQQRLDIESRLRLFHTVCEAVSHAHARRVIHRDLKPSNILVDEVGRVKLLDFGIAKLLTDEPSADRTSTGMRLMTPDYASPEQAFGRDVSGSSDVYQLGLLLYELLTGERPSISGMVSESVRGLQPLETRVEAPSRRIKRALSADGEARAAVERIASARSTDAGHLRRRLYGDLDTIACKALRWSPEQRYASVEELAADVERSLQGLPIRARPRSRWYGGRKFILRHRARLATAIAAAAVTLTVAILWPQRSAPVGAEAVQGSVAVFPFRTSGADPTLAYLQEGMVDLLATKLTGEGGPRAIEPATVLASWRSITAEGQKDLPRREALQLARSVGAERLIAGEVVGRPDAIILSASLIGVPAGTIEGRATVEGPADSLQSLVDRLTARLLLLDAGRELRPLSDVATVSLPALRSYLEGETASRAARHDEAYRRFSAAVAIDSGFAVAAVRAYQAGWLSGRSVSGRLLTVAWRERERLDELDRAYLSAILGPRYPAPSTQRDRFAALHRLVELAPDWVESQYLLADRFFHWAPLIGIEDGKMRAMQRFRRTIELDSSHAPSYRHLVPLLYAAGETREATRLVNAYLRRRPSSGISQYLRWRMAAATGDKRQLERVRAGMDTLPDLELLHIFRTAIADTVAMDDADLAISILRRRALSPSMELRVLRELYLYEMLRGRPRDAVRVAERLAEGQMSEIRHPRLEQRSTLVNAELYGDGDPAAATRARQSLVVAVFAPDGSIAPGAKVPDVCTLFQWRLWNGEIGGVDQAVEWLRADETSRDSGPVCALLLGAIHATRAGRLDATLALARLDSALATGPETLYAEVLVPANHAAARLHEMRGEDERALAAIRRRMYDFDSANFLLAPALRKEGRLAARSGDPAGAERAYRYYLALRSDPEPALRAQVDSVRAELNALKSRRR